MTAEDVSDYRLAPLLVARIVGVYLVALALSMFAATAVMAAADLPADLLVVLLVVGVLGLFGAGWWLRSRAYVVRFGPDGYRVRMVRGAGVTEADWAAVKDVVTASPRGIACLVLRLRDGRATTIPVEALAVDREQLVRDVRERLQRGHGLRKLGSDS